MTYVGRSYAGKKTASFTAPDGTEKSVDFIERDPPIITNGDEEILLNGDDVIKVQEKIGLFGYPYTEMADRSNTSLWISILILAITVITVMVSVFFLRNTSVFKNVKMPPRNNITP